MTSQKLSLILKKSIQKLAILALLFSFGIGVNLSFQPIQRADAILEFLGCDDDDNDGLTFSDCFSGGGSNDGRVITFTEFKGDLTAPSTDGYAPGLTRQTDLRSFILAVTNFALGFLGLLAVLVIIYGGVMMVTSAGDSDKASVGKKALTTSTLGLLLVMGSFAIVNTILQAPGGDSQTQSGTNLVSTTSMRGVSGRQQYNFLASEVRAIMEKLFNSYQFHVQAKSQIEAIGLNIKNYVYAQTELGSNTCQVPYSDCVRRISDYALNQINLINNYINNPNANIDTVAGLTRLRNALTTATTERLKLANEYIRDNDCNTSRYFMESVFDSGSDCDEENVKFLKEEHLRAYADYAIYAQIYDGSNFAFVLDQSFATDLKQILSRSQKVQENLGANNQIATNNFNALQTALTDEISMFDTSGMNNGTYFKVGFEINSASQSVISAIFGHLREIYDILNNIRFVDTIITADIAQGNAPLIVNFSTVGSTDPSGRTITDSQISWDLNGDGEFATASTSENLLNCNEGTGATASCIFVKPGTYRVSVKINPSAEFASEIAPGISYVDIRVNPPATKINLEARTSASTTTDILKYDQNGVFIETDRSNLYVTLAEAQAGIVFDASKTQFGPNSRVRWNFGTPSVNNEAFETFQAGQTKTQAYPANGTYLVRFEVENQNGIVDRKVFNVVVSDLAPRITNPARVSQINQEVTFDGSNSTGDGSPIIFNWSVEKLAINGLIAKNTNNLKIVTKAFAQQIPNPGQIINQLGTSTTLNTEAIQSQIQNQIVNIGIQSSKRTEDNANYVCSNQDSDDQLKCTFKKAGNYRVSLQLVKQNDPSTVSYTEITNIQVSSNPPTAGFNVLKVTESAPALYKLDASKLSFDPDDSGIQNMEFSWEINPANCVVAGYGDQNTNDQLIETSQSIFGSQTPCSALKEFSAGSSIPAVKFTEKGNYSVNLVIRSQDEKTSLSLPAERSITVDNILDLTWANNMNPSALMTVIEAEDSETGESQAVGQIEFRFNSSQAVAWELDFGDGETANGQMINGVGSAVHNYTKAGKYNAKLTVYDSNDVMNSISRNIYIGNSDSPVAIIKVLVNGSEVVPSQLLDNEGFPVTGSENVIVVNRKDLITLNAENSVNTDGTSRQLRYLWNVNNNERQGTTQSLNHQFRDLSGRNQYFEAKLTVTNQRNVAQKSEDSVKFMVVGEAPTLRSITAVPTSGDTTTPVAVRLTALGAEDADGQISQYKWWYSPVSGVDSDERLGLQITSVPNAVINIGTRGETGERRSYRFGIELTDSDNISVSTDSVNPDRLLQIPQPVIEVINGPNTAPVARFTVDRTSVFVGEAVNFVSSSFDPDQGGSIKTYEWDFGDGNRLIGANLANVSHIYRQANVNGYRVRLRVTDNADSVGTSDSLLIYVDAEAQPPVPAFTHEQIGDSRQVRFNNQSTADEAAGAELVRYSWDFNVAVDSNGDGIADNDIDSGEANPTYTYPEYGVYRARLTVEDNQGQKRFVTNFVNIRPASPIATSFNNFDAQNNLDINGASNGIKSYGANIFEASNSVDLTLLIISLGSYLILLMVANQKRKTNS